MVPLSECIVVTHAKVAACTQDHDVIKCCYTTLGCRYVVATVKVKHRNFVATPPRLALALKLMAVVTQPHLFLDSFWNSHFSCTHHTSVQESKQMPYDLQKSPKGYFVVNRETGKRYSKKPIPLERAQRQRRAIYASENGYVLNRRSPRRRSHRRSRH